MKLETKKRRSVVAPIACVATLLVLYVLSTQPVLILAVYGAKYELWTFESALDVLNFVYTPLDWMFRDYNWLQRAFIWYASLWSPLYPDSLYGG